MPGGENTGQKGITMGNKEAAEMFAAAIKQLAGKPDNLNNLESYLGQHFNKWLEKFANTPEGMAAEMKHFAEMEI